MSYFKNENTFVKMGSFGMEVKRFIGSVQHARHGSLASPNSCLQRRGERTPMKSKKMMTMIMDMKQTMMMIIQLIAA